MVLIIRDYITGANTNEDGDIIFNLISRSIMNGVHVTLSFRGITSVSSSFLNSAFVPLFEFVSVDNVKRRLKIIDSNKFINGMIVNRFKQEENDYLINC